MCRMRLVCLAKLLRMEDMQRFGLLEGGCSDGEDGSAVATPNGMEERNLVFEIKQRNHYKYFPV